MGKGRVPFGEEGIENPHTGILPLELASHGSGVGMSREPVDAGPARGPLLTEFQMPGPQAAVTQKAQLCWLFLHVETNVSPLFPSAILFYHSTYFYQSYSFNLLSR